MRIPQKGRLPPVVCMDLNLIIRQMQEDAKWDPLSKGEGKITVSCDEGYSVVGRLEERPLFIF